MTRRTTLSSKSALTIPRFSSRMNGIKRRREERLVQKRNLEEIITYDYTIDGQAFFSPDSASII
jgi:hypothetical protein